MRRIRPASISDSRVLTHISFAAKKYWNYPKEYFKIWEKELTITAEYIQTNVVYIVEEQEQAIGYFSLVEVKEEFWAGKVFVNKGFWLEHIFILPDYIGQGIGSQLIDILKLKCREMKIDKIYIFSDPHATGFYDKLGAQYRGESPSSIEGRTVSQYELRIDDEEITELS